jgi:hypothetical protein
MEQNASGGSGSRTRAHAAETRPVVVRLLPELRRAAVLGVVGLTIVGACAAWLTAAPEKILIGVVAAGLGLPIVFGWRLEFDGATIVRTRRWSVFGRVRDAWPIDDCARGLVEPRGASGLHDSSRPWYRRSLDWSIAEESGARVIRDAVAAALSSRPLPSIPPIVVVEQGDTFELSEQGVRRIQRGRAVGPLVAWTAIDRVVLRLPAEGPWPMSSAEFSVPAAASDDRRVWRLRLMHHQGRPLWRGADAILVRRALEAFVPSSRLIVTVRGRPPQTEAEWAMLREAMLAKRRELRLCLTYVVGPMFALCIAVAVWENMSRGASFVSALVGGLLVIGVSSSPIVVLFGVAHREQRRRWRAVETWTPPARTPPAATAAASHDLNHLSGDASGGVSGG